MTVVRGSKTRPLSLSLPKTPSAAHQRRKAVSMLSGVSGELLREAIVLHYFRLNNNLLLIDDTNLRRTRFASGPDAES